MNNTKNTYRERIYGSYVSARETSLAPQHPEGLSGRERYLRRLIKRYFPPDRTASIFELGCGHGALLYFAQQSGYTNVEGVDVSKEQIESTRQLGIQNAVCGDVFTALNNRPDASLDAVIAFDVLEHFTRDEAIRLVDEVFRVLKAGGRFIAHMPNAESPMFGRIRYGDLTHEMAYTRTSLTQLLMASGFSHVDCHEDTPIPGPWKGNIRWLLWKMIRGMFRVYLAAETGDTGRRAIFSQNFLCVAIKSKGADESLNPVRNEHEQNNHHGRQ